MATAMNSLPVPFDTDEACTNAAEQVAVRAHVECLGGRVYIVPLGHERKNFDFTKIIIGRESVHVFRSGINTLEIHYYESLHDDNIRELLGITFLLDE
jgi:hypothetical protein